MTIVSNIARMASARNAAEPFPTPTIPVNRRRRKLRICKLPALSFCSLLTPTRASKQS